MHVRMKSLNPENDLRRKRFIVLKTVNHFSKIKETLTVKLKMNFVDHLFSITPNTKKKINNKIMSKQHKNHIKCSNKITKRS
jgi:hypothetical protein